MTRIHDLSEIHAAELRVAQARRNTLDSVHRVQTAVRAAVTRPTILVLIMGAAGLWGSRLARRTHAAFASDGLNVVRPPVAAGFVAALVARYGMQFLTSILQRAWAAREERVAQAGVEASKTSSTAHAASDFRQ